MDDDEETDLLLDPDCRYSCSELREYLNRTEVNANWDSCEVVSEGTLANGEFFVWLDGPKKWLHAWEQYLNEWSSCMRVAYMDEVPQELWDAAEKYSDELNRAFEESKQKHSNMTDEDKNKELTFKCPYCGGTNLQLCELVPVYSEVRSVKLNDDRANTEINIPPGGNVELRYSAASEDDQYFVCIDCEHTWDDGYEIAEEGGLLDESGNQIKP